MAERPALTKRLGKPSEEVLVDFVKTIPDKPAKETTRDGVRFYPGSNLAVWRTLGLAEWDKHVTGRLSEHTRRSLRDMLLRMSDNGAFVVVGEVEVPHITTDFELTLQAARAITAAPGWLASLKDEELLRRVARMKDFLRDSPPRNDYERILRLQLAALFPKLVTREQRDTAMQLLTRKQQADGGWSLRHMSAPDNWRTPMSEFVLNLIASLPDAANPESDPYMTAFAIVLMRQNGVPASDARIRRGIAWLKREQRVSGRWWMHSLYRGNYHYITYIATAQALKALALCNELR
jgi:squalene-hopene/tetraprenyl-beta-curcumene cyclase